jgi:hypothetical protein
MTTDQKLKEWVDTYLAYIERITPQVHVAQEEGYKFLSVNTFQAYFDIDAPDLVAMLDKAIYPNNLCAGSWYFPRKMLLLFAEWYQDETRNALKALFDESKPVAQRITQAQATFDALMSRRNEELHEKANSFIGLRFLSLLLGYRYPETHNAIKPREWKFFASYVNNDFYIPKHTSAGEQYAIISEHIDRLRGYISHIPKIKEIKDLLTEGLVFKDEAYRWMAQDVIYVTSRVISHKKGQELAHEATEATDTETTANADLPLERTVEGMEFPLEQYLEHFIVENWKSIDFGEPLDFFIDADGVEGRQYVTDVGIIDVLAKDRAGNFVVIELKKGRGQSAVIGQILAYMNWVEKNLVDNGKKVRGIVIAADAHPALLSAQQAVADRVQLKYYDVSLMLRNAV